MHPLERQLIDLVKAKSYALCCVESVTGGQISQRITSVPGASEVFWAGLVVYDPSAKESVALVPPSTITQHGVVSAEVAIAMARGGLDRMAAGVTGAVSSINRRKGFLCISTTGLAGPGGGKPDKPVGLCFVGLARDGFSPRSVEVRCSPGLDRAQYQKEFSDRALSAAIEFLRDE